jgi:transcriptional regulator with XRE-family HTH domain
MAVLRQAIGETLRGIRLRQRRTLREVSTAARVSLGYLSEIERGQKEPSSELLASICGALGVTMSEVFREVADSLRRSELQGDRAHVGIFAPARPSIGRPAGKPGQQGPQIRGGSVVAV